jgi:hypothetical protein
MAGKTIRQLEMRFPHMTLVALRDGVLDSRGMTGMAA